MRVNLVNVLALRSPALRPLRPGAAVVALGGAVWLALRLTAPAGSYPALVVGWLLFVLLVATGAAVFVGTRAAPPGATGMAYTALADGAGLLLLLPWLDTGTFGFLAALRVYALFIGWLGLVVAVGWQLRRLGMAAVPLLLSLALAALALPVLSTPVVRATADRRRAAALFATAYGAPTVALLSALRPDVPFAWTQQPVMYTLTPIGQDYPLPIPTWWVLPVTSGALAFALVLLPRPHQGIPIRGNAPFPLS